MAASPEAQILNQIKQDHLTCHICQCPYLLPKALPCLHTFCTQCLQDFLFSRRYDIEGVFPCPVCRVQAELPKEGVEGFPDNHLVVTLMDTVHQDEGGGPSLYPNLSHMMSHMKLSEESEKKGLHAAKPPTQNSATAPPKPPRLTPPTRPSRPPQPARPSATPQRSAQTAVPGPRSTHTARPHGNETPTSISSRPTPVQRKLVLPVDSYPVPVVLNCHGAEVSFGRYGAGLTDFQKPLGLAVSPEGYIVVGDQRDNRIFIFERTGQLKTIFTCQGKIQTVAINSRGLIYVANTQAKRSLVTCYNSRGHTVASLGSFFTFEKPHGVAVTEDNHMAVTSIDTHQVYLLNEYGKMTHKFTGKGKDGKRLNYPYHVTVSKKNRIIVSDYGNDCIKVFDNTGKCKVQFGKYGFKSGQLNGPRGVCVDTKDNIVVADSRNHRIQVFNPKGQFVSVAMTISQEDAGIGGCPMNVAVTTDSRLVVLFSGGSFAQIRVYPYNH